MALDLNNPSMIDIDASSEEEDEDDEESSGNNVSSETSSSTGARDTGKVDEYQEIREMASEETRSVKLWRIVLILAILAVGGVVATWTYVILDNEMAADSTDAFVLFANTIEDTFKFQVYSIFEANRALSHAITTSAMTTQQRFPYVNIPAFEAHAYEARKQAGFVDVTYCPVARHPEGWIEFAHKTREWIEESKAIYDDLEPGEDRKLEPARTVVPKVIWRIDDQGIITAMNSSGLFYPSKHTSPPPLASTEAYQSVDLFTLKDYKDVSLAAVALKDAVFSPFREHFVTISAEDLFRTFDQSEPHSIAAQPVYKDLTKWSKNIVGYVFTSIAWNTYMANLVPDGVRGIFAVLRNSCNQSITYELDGGTANFVGIGDWHDDKFNGEKRVIDFAENYFDPDVTSQVNGHCQFFLDVYPSETFKGDYHTHTSMQLTMVVASLFLLMAAIFIIYDAFVQRRNNKVVGVAARSNAIVSSLFPTTVRNRLLEEQEEDGNDAKSKTQKKSSLRVFLSGEHHGKEMHDGDFYKTKPIADLFPETTVLFGDIVGFTAWSSVREPSQVFTLLETVYHAFDDIAKRRRIFKVETVGDCYVAVCGLPEPRKDHVVQMARFSRDCMFSMWNITKKLEVRLGPDTGDLSMRMGLHSGPVTAGVLRGERSRFQLFGDTMNTASRMESTGVKSCIQLSKETADSLIAAGKASWVKPREDKVYAKGKGLMETYWLELGNRSDSASVHSNSMEKSEMEAETDCDDKVMDTAASKANSTQDWEKFDRLVSWNVEVLLKLLRNCVARRNMYESSSSSRDKDDDAPCENNLFLQQQQRGGGTTTTTVLDEVKEIITLPTFDATAKSVVSQQQQDPDSVELDPVVVEQLQDYVKNIALMYRDNPFHNFEHASHVTMSVNKLLSRIIAPSDDFGMENNKEVDASYLHDHTYGITSDPLTQFSCVLSALIHDVDHQGVPNAQLVKEHTTIAANYNNKSVAEQNSVDIAWELLMQEETYADLRRVIYTNPIELQRFRQLMVNSVMATDIVDPELKQLRNERWEKAFSRNYSGTIIKENKEDAINRKATIVIEHLIQASDVAHTMQHWHIYRKWNEHFFMECYQAYKLGRAEKDPSIHWYQGEIGFFDFYIIPLAKKLKDCGVFGVSGDEYLNYARQNRQEWKIRGQEVVNEMVETAHRLWKDAAPISERVKL